MHRSPSLQTARSHSRTAVAHLNGLERLLDAVVVTGDVADGV